MWTGHSQVPEAQTVTAHFTRALVPRGENVLDLHWTGPDQDSSLHTASPPVRLVPSFGEWNGVVAGEVGQLAITYGANTLCHNLYILGVWIFLLLPCNLGSC